jgi:hypothetical protein
VTTALLPRETATSTSTCQAFAGSLLVPCPNAATETTVLRGQQREVCPAHVSLLPRQSR